MFEDTRNRLFFSSNESGKSQGISGNGSDLGIRNILISSLDGLSFTLRILIMITVINSTDPER